MKRDSICGAGAGWRRELAADFLAAPHVIDFVEIVAESCLADPGQLREALSISKIWPVVLHGVKLSLGSAEGIDRDRARLLARLARRLKVPAITEHVALTRAGDIEIGHLTALPFSREAVAAVVRNVAVVRRHLPDVPLHLENIAWTMRWPDDEMSEGDFYCEILEKTGCGLLLDISNLYANALNSGVTPEWLLQTYPVEKTEMVHIAGGVWQDGFYLDTHAHDVPQGAFRLLSSVFERAGPVPTVLERDGNFPVFEELEAEVREIRRRARAASEREKQAPEPGAGEPKPASVRDEKDSCQGSLAERQRKLATLLTSRDRPGVCDPFLEKDIWRTRAVLFHKRIDEALPLLPNLARHGDIIRRMAAVSLSGTQRAERGAGVADALRIAESASGNEQLRRAAVLDRLALRARFRPCRKGSRYVPRRGPFVLRECLPDGKPVWAFKLFGSRLRVFQ